MQVILVSAGANEFTNPVYITELNGKDISATPVSVAFGDQNTPGPFNETALKTIINPSKIAVVGMVGNKAPGIYYMYVKLIDSPETVIRCTAPFQVV